MTRPWQSDVAAALGSSVVSSYSLAGGDICQAFLLTLADEREVFLKTRSESPGGFFHAEARGLEWLRETASLRIPEVLAVDEEFLVLEYLRSAPRRCDFDQKLGRGLAALHSVSDADFGLESDNFIGTLPQSNVSRETWTEFYVEQRLKPLVAKAITSQVAPNNWKDSFERLYQALPDIVPEEPPSRLHGDLWGGNLLVGPSGEPCLIDPAIYAGHREMDLAMMRLFGGFGADVFASYKEAFPLLDGHEQRVPLYQLYPLLVHVNLFGGGYVASVERALQSLPR